MIRRSKFGSSYNPYFVSQIEEQNQRTEIFTPSLGLHRGDAPQDIAPGFTPSSQNFVSVAGKLTPRSGLSQFKGGDAEFGGAPAIGAAKVFDVAGSAYALAASNRTLSAYDPATDAWSALSYVLVSPFTIDNTPSGTSHQYWDATHIYDAGLDQNLAVFTNHKDVPKSVTLIPSVGTYSDLTDFISLASTARSVCAFDNRLVWWNVREGSSTSLPQRVMWSARGLPRNYQLASGAGFEDLLDMSGMGTKIIADHDSMILFGNEEIWRGRKIGDPFVFGFYAIEKQFGAPYPRTVAKTPIGTIFLARNLDLYLVHEDTVSPLGSVQEGGTSRIQAFLQETLYEPERAWSVYDPSTMRYCLFYTGSDSVNGFATRALFFNVTERSYFPQKFAIELSAGLDFNDPGVPTQWDQMIENWEDISFSWDDLVIAGSGDYVNTFSSNGTALRFYSGQTTDNGANFTAEWTSHGLNRADQMRYERLSELFMEYESALTSNVSVIFSNDYAFSSTDSRSIVLPPTQGRAFIPGDVVGASPFFRVQIADGSTPKIGRFQAKLIEAGLYSGNA